FSYYAWQQRGTPNWFASYQSGYVARANGTLARPPRTFAQQSVLLKQVATPGGTVTKAVSNVQVVTPLGQFAQQSKNVTLVKAAGSPSVAIQRSQTIVQARKQLEVAATKAPA